jgi:hypothetical protein
MNISRLITSFALLVVAGFSLPQMTLAQVDIGLGKGGLGKGVGSAGGYDTASVTDTSLSESIGKVIKVVLSFTGTIFFALTVYAGFLWMTASGNEEQVTKAKSILQMATIGLIISLSAYGITTFVLSNTVAAARNATCLGTEC